MPFSCADLRNRFPLTHIAFVAALTLLLSGWTCSAIFVSCQGIGQQPQIAVLSPDTIPGDTNSVLLTVDGSGFTTQSQILWNGNSLQTTFLDPPSNNDHSSDIRILWRHVGEQRKYFSNAGNDFRMSKRREL
jgi:hypothetical protein